MSNYYNNMKQLLEIADTPESLEFYKENIEYTKGSVTITQKEYLLLMSQLTKKKIKLIPLTAKFEINQTYQSRGICDHECILEIKTISRTNKTLTYSYDGEIRRSKIKLDSEGNEYIKPDNYSMAPTFRASRKAVA